MKKRLILYLNFIGCIDGVSDLNGMLALSGATNGTAAFTIGHYSFGPDNYTADWHNNTFIHEYGHYIQSQFIGSGYLLIIAKPSLASAAFTSHWSGVRHRERWFEVSASKLGANYFDKHYGSGKAGYSPNSSDYFNIEVFINKVEPGYVNPRDGKTYQNENPVDNPSLVIWDFIF